MPADPLLSTGTYLEYEHLLGRQIFGKPSRMLAGLWIARLDGPNAQAFHGAQFADWCIKTKRPWVQATVDFKRFETMGMIELVSTDRCHTYRRLDSPLWDMWRWLSSTLHERETGERIDFEPTPQRIHRMVADLQKIHMNTAPLPLEPTSEQPTVVEPVSKGQVCGWPGNYRERGLHGELRCSKCTRWKPPGDFSRRPNQPGLYKSQCKACMAETQRTRYLGLKKIEALNSVGLTFIVAEFDDVDGLACADCGQPIEAGQEVAGHTRLWHTMCPTIPTD